MLTLRQACTPRDSVFDPDRRDTVLDLPDLIEGRIDPSEFFAENYVTEGMSTLLRHGFERLEGRSNQGVFQLRQAMGGGKTHNLLALGLLARHPQFRPQVMAGFHEPSPQLGPVRVVAFTGRETDVKFGIWGAIAEQLGRKAVLDHCYSPLRAPGRQSWIDLLRGEPLLILLDELPPYLENAASVQVGASNLAKVTATAIANLLVAIGSAPLSGVCLVITDLVDSYEGGSAEVQAILGHMEKETQRTALPIEPIRLVTDEFYHILRKRIFAELPGDDDIAQVAAGYGTAVREAKQMDVTSTSPDDMAASIQSSYPFHPGIRDLYARFRRNPGFQQTRALIRLMRGVVARMWQEEADRCYLIAAHDLDLTDRSTDSELSLVNQNLREAIAHDISSTEGTAQAQQLDSSLGDGADAQDVMRLLLVASLANVPNAQKGLNRSEIVSYLSAPGRDITGLGKIVEDLRSLCWYLHEDAQGRLYVRRLQNLNARVRTMAEGYLHDQALKELRERLTGIFDPSNGRCYQKVAACPPLDSIVELNRDKVLLVIAEPATEISGGGGVA